jgi:glycosyltransferase involved in cell wall biosynthesis
MTKYDAKIAIDARMSGHTGIGRYIRNLVNALMQRNDSFQLVLIVNPTEDPTAVWDWLSVPKAQLARIDIVSFGKSIPIYSMREQFWLPKVISSKGVDLFHSPHFNIPLLTDVPIVSNIHDVTYLTHPESAPHGLGRIYAKYMLTKAATRSLHVITGTHASSQSLQDHLPLGKDKISVIGHGPEEMAGWVAQVRRGSCESISPRVRELPQFILSVGNHLPHKNQSVLIEALGKLGPIGFPKLVLALAGPTGKGTKALEQAAKKYGVADRVEILGAVEDKDLAWLYDNAVVMIHPSKSEGFGLPVLEAMRVACPVVCSDIPPLREVAQDGALFCPAENAEAFAGAIGQLMMQPNKAEALSKKAYKRAGLYSYKDAAEKTSALYCRVLETVASRS